MSTRVYNRGMVRDILDLKSVIQNVNDFRVNQEEKRPEKFLFWIDWINNKNKLLSQRGEFSWSEQFLTIPNDLGNDIVLFFQKLGFKCGQFRVSKNKYYGFWITWDPEDLKKQSKILKIFGIEFINTVERKYMFIGSGV